MSQFDQHGNPTFGSQSVPPAKDPNRIWKFVAIGCLGAFLTFVVVCGITGWLVVRNAKTIGATFVREAMTNAINDSTLDPAQKQALITRIDQLTGDFESGKLTMDDLDRIAERFSQSPLLSILAVWGFEKKLFEESGLSPEEREQARVQTRRLFQGALDKKISQADFESAVAVVSTRDAQGKYSLKSKLTDEELRQFITNAKQAADNAEVTANPPELDIAAEFNRVIDEALGQQQTQPQSTNPALPSP